MKTNVLITKAVLSIFLILFGLHSMARVYYVSSSYAGTTSNGNFTTPWKSLSNVQSNMSIFLPGDSISFKSGDDFTGTLSISKSGVAGNPITFNSYGIGNKPRFIGTGSTITYLIYLYNRNYIVFDGLEITDPSISLTDRTQISKIQRVFGFDGTSSFNTIKNCTISLVGIGTYWVGSNNTMDHCDIGNLRMVVNDIGGNNDYGANPIVISSANNNITHNYFHDCWANSYDYTYDGGAVEFYGSGSSNNFIGYNTFYDCNGVVENGSGNGGLIENNQFAYNKFINNGSLFYINNGGSFVVTVSNMMFYNNVIIENTNNRLLESNMGSMSTSVATQGIVVFKNNVFQLSTGVDVVRSTQWNNGQLIHENNVYKLSNNSITNFTLNASEITTTQNIWNNTTSNNILDWDLMPTSTSLLINWGQSLGFTNDYVGNSITGLPDAGILEYKQNNTAISPLNISIKAGNILCNGSTTDITVKATGGTPPYLGTGTFNVSAGTYYYTVIDSTGSSINASVTINQPAAILINTAVNSNNTNGTTTITTNATGGTGNYLYAINNGIYQTSNIFSGLLAGTYSIYVKDSLGCTAKTDVTINQPILTLLSLQVVTVKNVSCKNRTDGYIEVMASGGVSPYNYKIGNGIYSSQNIFSNLSPGMYTITVKDINNNTTSITVTIRNSKKTCSTTFGKTSSSEFENIIIYPNPSNQNFNVGFLGKNEEVITLQVIDLFGKKIYETRKTANQNIEFGSEFRPGMYIVKIIQGENEYSNKIVKL